MVKRWLITGGCGFIGRNLISHLIAKEKYFIRIVDNMIVGSKEDLTDVCDFSEVNPSFLKVPEKNAQGVELVVGDILDAELAGEVCKGFDVIVHLAANTGVAPSVKNPIMDFKTNVIGTINYLEAARYCRISRFVFASSSALIGEVEPPITEDMAPHPVSPYGASKLAGEGYCSAYFRSFGVETVCLRFGNVYGPRSEHKNSVVAKFIKQALQGETLEIYGDGNQTRDFIYIDDLVDAIQKAATISTNPAPFAPIYSKLHIGGQVFQIATSKETTIEELVDTLLKILARHGYVDVNVVHRQKRQGDVKRSFSNISKAFSLLDWSCQNDLWAGLGKTVKWFIMYK